jgi:hypothetical protein
LRHSKFAISYHGGLGKAGGGVKSWGGQPLQGSCAPIREKPLESSRSPNRQDREAAVKRFLFRLSLSRALGLALVAFLTLPAAAQQPGQPRDPRRDVTKNEVIERPAKAALANAIRPLVSPNPTAVAPAAIAGAAVPMALAMKPVRLDITKSVQIERPAVAVVANSAPAATVPTPMKSDAKDNPTVKPGEVNWHASFDAACAAAKKSGKPVLLLHMMGQLDKQFC